jgi:hypothetical protein
MEWQWDAYNYYVESIGDKKLFFKEHRKERISKGILELYHTLHHSLTHQDKEVYFWDAKIEGKKIDTRKIHILDLDPKWIYEATNIENKEDVIVTNPKYIPGKILQEYESEIGKERVSMICDAITRSIEMKTKLKFTDMYWVTPNNIKVHIKDTTAELIVTDISCNIKNFFHTGENVIILDTLQEEYKKKSMN